MAGSKKKKSLEDRQTVGSFAVQGILGHGGMGVVYRCVGPDGTPAAVKVLHAHQAGDEMLKRFHREATIRVEHPNVIRVLGTGEDDHGAPYIAFELLEGVTLRDRLKEDVLPLRDVIEIGAQAARGLSVVHELGIVHRDLKPGNIFLCIDGTVKVLDFGVALAGEDDRVTQGERRAIGTPSFLAPEQAQGDPNIDARADVWALGVVLYEALSGVRPFKKETALATMLAVVVEEAPPLKRVAPHVPDELAAIIHRCMQKRRELRWESAEEFARALQAVDITGIGAQIPVRQATDLEAPTVTAMATGTGSLQAEKRVVSLVLATGVRDMSAIRQVITERGGLLVPILGKAIGLFGGEAWEGDEMLRAATAALATRTLADRVSVASGRASLSGKGISGAVVRRAEEGCEAGLAGVAMDAETARMLKSGFALRQIGDNLFELTEERRPIWPLERTADEAHLATVGRDVELAQLQRIVDGVLGDGRAHVMLALGPPGIGKTRVLRHMEELLEQAEDDVFILSARADPLRRTNAVALLGSAIEGRARLNHMLRGGPRIDPDATPQERVRAVQDIAREALEDESQAVECAAFLGELLGIEMPESPGLRAARADPRLMADRLQLAVSDYLQALCDTRAVALLFDDLQWSDAASLDVLDMLLDQLSNAPLLVCGAARPELDQERVELFVGRELVRMDLRGLSMSDVASLAAATAGRELEDDLVKAVFERSGGNPLFVEQIVLALGDEGLLDDPPADLPLPLTVEAAVQSRLDHLPPQEKELCKRAAIFERPFTPDEVTGLGIKDADALLASLRRRDLVAGRARSRQGARREYRFRSTLMADVAYRMISDEHLPELHRLAAEMLDVRGDVAPEEVAAHYERAGESANAAARYAEAARVAAQRFDTGTVLRCSQRALALGPPEETRFELHMARAEALRFRGKHDEQNRELSEAQSHSRSLGQRARALAEQAAWLSRRGFGEEAVKTADKALHCARQVGDAEACGLALCRLAAAQLYAGGIPKAQEALEEAASLAQAGVERIRPLVADLRAQLASARGDLGERRDAFRAAVELYARAGDLRRAANAELNLADAANRVGAYAEAAGALADALEKCRRVGNRLGEGYALLNLGYAQIRQGDGRAGMTSLDQAASLAESTHDARLAVFAKLYRARGLLQQGTRPGPDDEPERTAEEAEEVGLPGVAVLARTLAAQGALAHGEVDRALELSSRALEMLSELGGVEEDEAEVYLTHARALEAAGRNDEGRAVRDEGRARVRDVADRIADGDWRRRFLEGVRAHRDLMAGD